MSDKKRDGKKAPKDKPISLAGPDFQELVGAFLQVKPNKGEHMEKDDLLITASRDSLDEPFANLKVHNKPIPGKTLSQYRLELERKGWKAIDETPKGKDMDSALVATLVMRLPKD